MAVYNPIQYLTQIRAPQPVDYMAPVGQFLNAVQVGNAQRAQAFKEQEALAEMQRNQELQQAQNEAWVASGGDLESFGKAMLGVNPAVGMKAIEMAGQMNAKQQENQVSQDVIDATNRLKAAIASGDDAGAVNAYVDLQVLRGAGLTSPTDMMVRAQKQEFEETKFDEQSELKRIDSELKQKALELKQQGFNDAQIQKEMDNEFRMKKLDLENRRIDMQIKNAQQKASIENKKLQMRVDAGQAKADEAPKFTDAQVTNAGFGLRMEEANKTITELEDGWLKLEGAIPSSLRSSESQKRTQAAKNFVRAILRKQSGAVIGDDEFEAEDIQYMPQLGDSKEVIEQKRKNRLQAIAAFKAGSGSAWNQVKKNYDEELKGSSTTQKGVVGGNLE